MTTPCILYPEKTDHLAIPREPWYNFEPTAAQTTDISNTDLRATLQNLTNAPCDLPANDALCREIDQLCTATLTIDEAFYSIGRKLSDVSNEQNKLADLYNTCHALETQWNEHHLAYKDLLSRSRELAGKAQGVVDDFREMVLPLLRNPGRTRSDKLAIMQEQIQVLGNTSGPSEKLGQDFLDFGRALDSYTVEFSRIVDGLAISGKRTEVDELADKMYDTKDAMDVVGQKVNGLAWKFAAGVAVAGIAFVLACVVPGLWVPAAAFIGIGAVHCKRSGHQFLEARRGWKAESKKYEAIKTKHDFEKACLSQMVKLESTLLDLRPLVQEVTMKLGIFASVWAAITADIRQLKDSLHRAENTTSLLFIDRVQRLERMYASFSQALRHYQVTVRIPQHRVYSGEKTGT